MALPNLSSIDVAVVDGRDPWDVDLLIAIHQFHRKLGKVLIQGDNFFIWTLVQTMWTRRTIPHFSSWDIIRGIVDGI